MHAGPAGVVSPVFVGRTAELGVVRRVIDRAAAGDSGLLLIAGEAGVGKTRLVAEAVGYGSGQGMQVLSGHCVQLGIEGLPFAPLAEALRELIRDTGRDRLDEVLGPARELVARLIPTPGVDTATPTALTSSQLLELVLGLIERLSARRPLLLVVEDLHWADRSTLELASFLAQNLRGVPVAIVMTFRSDEVDRRHPLRVLLASWERTRAITRIDLERFDRAEVRAQLAGILGSDPDPQILDLVFERSEGNAFLAEEILSMVREGDSGGLPPSLRDVLLARVDQLSDAAQRLLRIAAVAGRSVPERLLVAVAGMDETAVLTAVRESVDAHVLVVDEAGYSFRHTLARDAVYDDLLPGERVRLHTAYAEALSRDPGLLSDSNLSVAASLAHHSYAALDLPRALEASVAAGREALTGLAPREALAHYERALLIWPRVPVDQQPRDVDQAEVLCLAGQAAYQSGDIDRSEALLRQAIAELPTDVTAERRARVYASCAMAVRDLGRVPEAIVILEEALALLPEEPMSVVRAEVLAAVSNGLMRENEVVGCAEYGELAVAAARQVDAPLVEADALITIGHSRARLDGAEAGIAALRTGLELALAHGSALIAMRAYINYSDLMEGLGRSRESAEAAEAGIALAQRAGAARTVGTFLTGNLAESLLHLGEWTRTRELIDDALLMRPEGIFEATAQIIRAELALLSGELELSRSALERTKILITDPDDDQYSVPLASLETDLWRTVGDYDRASATALAVFERGVADRPPRYLWQLLWTAIRAQAERATGSIDESLVELAGSLEAGTAPERAYAVMCAAELGRVPDWTAAISAWRALGWPWPLAYSLLRHGGLAGDRAALVEAWTIAGELGARPLIAEAERVAAQRRIDLGLSRSPLDELNLTQREQEVLLLLAAGRSNPEIAKELFISPKTASVHVSNILTKLGLSSRVQAATLVHRLGLGT